MGRATGNEADRGRPARHRIRLGARGALAVALMAGMVGLTAPLTGSAAGAATLTPVVSGEAGIVTAAFDGAGNLYVAENNGSVKVLPGASGTIFGVPVTAGQLTTIESSTTNVPGLAFDAAGDLFLTDTSAGTVDVLPAASGTIFGVPATANTLTTVVSGLDNPIGVAFDNAGNLYVASQTEVSVLPASSGTLFGRPVAANALTTLVSGLTMGTFVTVDASGNLYVSDLAAGTVTVLPTATGTLFGTAVTADTPTALLSGLSDPSGLSFDPAGNLYVDVYGDVGVLPAASGTIDGTSVTADTFTTVADGLLGDLGNTYHAGHLYIADQLMDSVDEMSTPTATVSGVTFTGSVANPVVEVTGTGFTSNPPTVAAGCGATGNDFGYGNLSLDDTTQSWEAGVPGDCIGIYPAALTSTEAIFTLGSFYPGGFTLEPGDAYALTVDGLTVTGTVSYTTGTATVTSVSPAGGPGAGGGKVAVSGTGFSGASAVLFGAVPAPSFSVNGKGTSIKTVAPPQAAGTVQVTVVTANGDSATTPGDEYSVAGPSIAGVAPASGPGNGGKKVTITGTGMQGATAATVTFGGTAATSVSVNGAGTKLTAVAPAGSGTVDVSVTTPGGTAVQSSAYTYLAPTATFLKPSSGSSSGGTVVTIRGTELKGVTTSSVLFGGVPAESVSVNGAGTKVTATAPPGSPGPVPVTVATAAGTTAPLAFTYTS